MEKGFKMNPTKIGTVRSFKKLLETNSPTIESILNECMRISGMRSLSTKRGIAYKKGLKESVREKNN